MISEKICILYGSKFSSFFEFSKFRIWTFFKICPRFNYHSKYWMIYLGENSYFIMIVALFLRLIFQKLSQSLKNLDSIVSNIWTSLNFNKKVRISLMFKNSKYFYFMYIEIFKFFRIIWISIITRNIGWFKVTNLIMIRPVKISTKWILNPLPSSPIHDIKPSF